MVRKNTVKKSDSDSESEMVSDAHKIQPVGISVNETNYKQISGTNPSSIGSVSKITTYMPYIILVLLIKILFIENYCRNHKEYNESFIRPSVMLEELADQSRSLFNWIGFQLARITDIFYWINEYLAEDLCNILEPCVRLLFSCMQFFKGYLEYFTSGLTWVSPSVGMCGSISVLIVIFWFFTRKPLKIVYGTDSDRKYNNIDVVHPMPN